VSAPANNLKHTSEAAAIGAQVAKAVAWVSGIFSLVACITLILAQIQIMQVDPLNDPTLKAMKARIPNDLNNKELRDSVRGLHLMTRRAFFANQTQQRATGVMLLFGVAIFLASIKTYVELRLKLPVPQGQAPREGGSAERSAGRWAVAAGGGLVVLSTLLLVFLSDPEFPLPGPPPAVAAAPAESAKPAEAAKPAEPAKPAETKPAETTPAVATPVKVDPLPLHAWPSFRGPGGNGIAGHDKAPVKWDGSKGENITWKVPIPKAGTNSPVVWGDKVFVAGADDDSRDIYAYDAKTGKLLWTGKTQLVTGSVPKVMDGTTYCAPTLTTDGERVYGVFATGDIVAFNVADGQKAWGWNLGAFKNGYGHSSSLILHGGLLLVQFDQSGKGRVLGVDVKKGTKVWDQTREIEHESWASPIVVNTGSRIELITLARPNIWSQDPMTGKILWSLPGLDGEIAPSAAYAAGRLFAVSPNMPLTAVQLGSAPKVLWKYNENQPDVSSPLATEKYVIMASSGGTVTCLDAATGKKLWEHDYEDAGFYASPVLVGDRVYLMDKRGVTFVLQLGNDFKQLAENPLGEKATCTPAIPEGRIYFRSDKNLYCVGKD
jgi:outer membrane protein assembly factor BamB